MRIGMATQLVHIAVLNVSGLTERVAKMCQHNYESIQVGREDNLDVLLVKCTDCELSFFSKVRITN